MNRIAAVATTVVILTAPLFVMADNFDDLETQVMFVLGRIAQLQAVTEGKSVTCAMIATRSSVRLGEETALIWNTFGAADPSDEGPSQYEPRAISHLLLDKIGTWTYTIPFNGVQGGKATCAAKITVLP